jgi:plasmid maintenance system antidote protein VapI
MSNSLNLSFGMANGEVSPVEDCQLRAAKSFKDSLKLCIKLSRVKRTQADLASQAGINACQFSKIIHGDFHLPEDSIPLIERLCGNSAMTQWFALQHGATLHVKTDQEIIQELRAQLAKVAA